jgi:hypothetical protein
MEDLVKYGSTYKSSIPPGKRVYGTSGADNTSSQRKPLPDVQTLLHMPEDAVWGLRKQDLRSCFLVLRSYARNPYPLNPPTSATPPSPTTPTADDLPPFLRLPVEIRQLIYSHLLPPATDPLLKGPHPRQLQTNIYFSQAIPASLLRLNHQIRSEALPLLYGSPSQTIFITIDYNIWAHKTRRGDLVLSSALTASIKHIHVSIHLGSEKRNNKIGDFESEARISGVTKGVKKVRKWLVGADLQSLMVSWQEPTSTYTWEQKRDILDGLRGLRAQRVVAGEINWGLDWNKGRKYRFETEYLKELERERQEDSRDCDSI